MEGVQLAAGDYTSTAGLEVIDLSRSGIAPSNLVLQRTRPAALV